MCDISEQRMNREDYPQLYRAADALSIKYQKRHYILLALYLGLLIVGTCLSFGDATICTNSIALVVFILSAVVYSQNYTIHYLYGIMDGLLRNL